MPAPAPRPAPSAPIEPVTSQESGNGSYPLVPDTSFAPAAGSVLGAPVPDDGIAASSGLAAEPSLAPAGVTADEMPEPEPARPADPERPERVAMAHAETAARTFDVAVTRRRPVVFEEDDDLDVPDFLK